VESSLFLEDIRSSRPSTQYKPTPTHQRARTPYHHHLKQVPRAHRLSLSDWLIRFDRVSLLLSTRFQCQHGLMMIAMASVAVTGLRIFRCSLLSSPPLSRSLSSCCTSPLTRLLSRCRSDRGAHRARSAARPRALVARFLSLCVHYYDEHVCFLDRSCGPGCFSAPSCWLAIGSSRSRQARRSP